MGPVLASGVRTMSADTASSQVSREPFAKACEGLREDESHDLSVINPEVKSALDRSHGCCRPAVTCMSGVERVSGKG